MLGFVTDTLLTTAEMHLAVTTLEGFLATHFLVVHEQLVLVCDILAPLNLTNVLLIRIMRFLILCHIVSKLENLVAPRVQTHVCTRLVAGVHTFRCRCRWGVRGSPWRLVSRHPHHQLLRFGCNSFSCVELSLARLLLGLKCEHCRTGE